MNPAEATIYRQVLNKSSEALCEENSLSAMLKAIQELSLPQGNSSLRGIQLLSQAIAHGAQSINHKDRAKIARAIINSKIFPSLARSTRANIINGLEKPIERIGAKLRDFAITRLYNIVIRRLWTNTEQKKAEEQIYHVITDKDFWKNLESSPHSTKTDIVSEFIQNCKEYFSKKSGMQISPSILDNYFEEFRSTLFDTIKSSEQTLRTANTTAPSSPYIENYYLAELAKKKKQEGKPLDDADIIALNYQLTQYDPNASFGKTTLSNLITSKTRIELSNELDACCKNSTKISPQVWKKGASLDERLCAYQLARTKAKNQKLLDESFKAHVLDNLAGDEKVKVKFAMILHES